MTRDGENPSVENLAGRLRDALGAACHPRLPTGSSVSAVSVLAAIADGPFPAVARARGATRTDQDVMTIVARLYDEHAIQLVRLVRLFVDDRNAAEDLVQEGFIRLARNAHRIENPDRAAAYLRSIVLNLARDHNRRGLVSLRHHLPADEDAATAEDEVVLLDDQQRVVDALRELPIRQRNCVVLRYYFESPIAEIAATMGISANSVKTHLKRGMASLERLLGETE